MSQVLSITQFVFLMVFAGIVIAAIGYVFASLLILIFRASVKNKYAFLLVVVVMAFIIFQIISTIK